MLWCLSWKVLGFVGCYKPQIGGIGGTLSRDLYVPYKDSLSEGGWCQRFFNFYPLGKDFEFDKHIFQRGWNHQLVILFWIILVYIIIMMRMIILVIIIRFFLFLSSRIYVSLSSSSSLWQSLLRIKLGQAPSKPFKNKIVFHSESFCSIWFFWSLFSTPNDHKLQVFQLRIPTSNRPVDPWTDWGLGRQ